MKFEWLDVEHKAFNDIKWIVARNTLLDYPDLFITSQRCDLILVFS